MSTPLDTQVWDWTYQRHLGRCGYYSVSEAKRSQIARPVDHRAQMRRVRARRMRGEIASSERGCGGAVPLLGHGIHADHRRFVRQHTARKRSIVSIELSQGLACIAPCEFGASAVQRVYLRFH